MLIRTKLLLNNLGLAGLAMTVGVLGIVGLRNQIQTSEHLAGPLWQTADATMELRLDLQTQQLAVASMRHDESPANAARQRIVEAGKNATTHVGELAELGIAGKEELAACQQALSAYDGKLAEFLAAHESWARARRELKENTDLFEALGMEMEDMGDGAVELLEKEPTRAVTWQDDVAAAWAAADGCMEGRIYMLEQVHWLDKLDAGDARAADPLQKALQTQHEAFERVAAAPVFQEQRTRDGRKVLDVYRSALATRTNLLPKYVDETTRFAAGSRRRSRTPPARRRRRPVLSAETRTQSTQPTWRHGVNRRATR
jgi:hypothetical protein